MILNDALKYMDLLFQHAFEILYRENLGVGYAEHIFMELCRTIADCPDIKPIVLELVSQNVMSETMIYQGMQRPPRFMPPEFIEFLTHMFRWVEIREIALTRNAFLLRDDHVPWSRDIADGLLDALKDDWEDKEFYRSFSE